MPHNPSWRHHYVPQFLLRYWAVGTDGALSQYGRKYDGTVGSVRRVPKAVGYERDLYRLDLGPGVAVDVFEINFLQRVDTEASKVIARLYRGEMPIAGADITILSRFMSSLLQRDPTTVTALKERGREDYERLVAYGRMRYAGCNVEAEAFEQFVQGSGASMVGQAVLATLRAAIDSRALGTRLNNLRWVVADLTGVEVPLMTSDRPLLVSDGGIDNPNGFVALALGPNLAAFGFTDARYVDALGAMSRERTVGHLNEHVVRQAASCAYGVDNRHLETVTPLLGNRPLPSIQQRLGQALRERRASDANGRIEEDPRFRARLDDLVRQTPGERA